MENFDYTISIGQLGEQLTLNQWVLGSSPRWCTRNSLTESVGLFFCCNNPGCRAGAPSRDENSSCPPSAPAGKNAPVERF